MKSRKLSSLFAATLLALPTLASAQTTAVPGFISYQGRVVDSSGNNVGTGTPVNRTVIFRIWNSPSSTAVANLIYSEAQTVTISEGEFSVLVGQGVANPTQTFGYSETAKKLADLAGAFTGSSSYLGVTVAGTGTIATTDNEITPRQQIVSTAFALRSKVAETVLSDAIGTGNIANNSITTAKFVSGSVTTSTIFDGSVTLNKLAANSVNSSKIVDGSVALADLATNSVNSSKIVDGSVALADLAGNSVNGSKIVDGSIAAIDLASNSVTTEKLAAGSVTAAKLGADVGTWGVNGNIRWHQDSVGIGTNNPVRGKLEVLGSGATAVTSPLFLYFVHTFSSVLQPNSTSPKFSIYAHGEIGAPGFWAFSDERIKRIEGRSDSVRDLESLLGIEVTDYSFIDTVAKGPGKQKKVIAQQVEKVFPQAISQSTEVVPDIYQKAGIQGGWVLLATNLKKGERVRLIAEADEGIHEVLEVSEDGFRTAFQPAGTHIFVYGREVDDFRTVDYDAIAMLNVSATQALKQEKDAEVRTLQDEVTVLRNENSELRDRLAAQEKRLTAMDTADRASAAKLAAIEKLLQGEDKPSLRTVSLTTAE